MKKLFTVLAVASVTALVACGPSAEEKAKMEQAKQDSIMQVENANKAAQEAAAMQEKEKAKQDSIAKADSLAKMAKPAKGKK